MPLRAQVFERFQLGPEVTEGTPVYPNRRPLGLGLSFDPQIDSEPIREMGNKAPVGMQVFKEHTEGNYQGALGYNEWIYILSSLLCKATISTPSTNGVWTLTVDATGGTYTLQLTGFSATANIAFDATAAQIKAALELVIGTGNVNVTGTGPFTISFNNRLKRLVATLVADDALATGGDAIVATTAATLSRLWTFLPSHFDPDDVQYYTMAEGSSNQGARAVGGTFRSASWEARPRESIEVSGSILAQLYQQGYLLQNLYFIGGPSGGTFKVTYKSVESAAITYSSGLTAATVQAALEAISTIGIGNVEVIGSNGGPFVVALAGDLWDDDATALTVTTPSFTGGSTPSAAFAFGLSGLSVTDIRVVPVESRNIGIWMGTTLDNMTQLSKCQGIRHDVGDRSQPVYTIDDRERSYSGTVEQAGDPTFTITVEQDSTADNYIQKLRRRDTIYVRIASEGIEIESGFRYRMECIFACNIREPGQAEVDGVHSGTYVLQCIYDSTIGSYMKWFIQSPLTAL